MSGDEDAVLFLLEGRERSLWKVMICIVDTVKVSVYFLCRGFSPLVLDPFLLFI